MPAGTFERRTFQVAVALAGLVPVAAGITGILVGPTMAEHPAAGWPAAVSLDSHFRYLSGLLLGIGLAFWSLVPRIAERGAAFRLLTAIVFVGGLGRLVSLADAGTPSPPMLGGLAMELLVTPLLCWWQSRVGHR